MHDPIELYGSDSCCSIAQADSLQKCACIQTFRQPPQTWIICGTCSNCVAPDPRAGGKLDLHCGDPIRLRVLLDGSVCEVFTSIGAVLTCRVNRRGPCTLCWNPAVLQPA